MSQINIFFGMHPSGTFFGFSKYVNLGNIAIFGKVRKLRITKYVPYVCCTTQIEIRISDPDS